MILMENFPTFSANVQACMDDAMTAHAFKDPSSLFSPESRTLGGAQVFGSLIAVLLQ